MHSKSCSSLCIVPSLYVQSLSSIYSWRPFVMMANAFVKPLPSLGGETYPGSCVLISATLFPSTSSASNTASSHLSHPKPLWRNIGRRSWRKGEGCCSIGCLLSCFTQILEDARLCETGCSIELTIIGIESPRPNVILFMRVCALWGSSWSATCMKKKTFRWSALRRSSHCAALVPCFSYVRFFFGGGRLY